MTYITHIERPGVYFLSQFQGVSPESLLPFLLEMPICGCTLVFCRQLTSGGTLQHILENQHETRYLPKGQQFKYSKNIDSRKYSRAVLGKHNPGKCALMLPEK